MSENWKPGDVAMVTLKKPDVATPRKEHIAMRDNCDSWASGTTYDRRIEASKVESVRRLVVIDPEDREQVDRLREFFNRNAVADYGPHWTDVMLAALREFANPTPPKPDEPTGLGAVVEDAEGERWIKIDEHSGCNDWVDLGARTHKPVDDERETVRHWYRNINAVRVLSEGVLS